MLRWKDKIGKCTSYLDYTQLHTESCARLVLRITTACLCLSTAQLLGYDWALRGALLHGVAGRIRRLELEVALQKPEALCFHGPRIKPPSRSSIIVEGVFIAVESTMKYLGPILDSRWNFRPHFTRLAPRLLVTASALSHLLPNLGGPTPRAGDSTLSMALYAAPVRAEALTARNVAALRRPQRVVAIRILRGYFTNSFEAASLLAGSPPLWDLEAKLLTKLYWWRVETNA
ncbi:uncharacterized protein LOC116774957 [Danaus plexippus]|uniref:uncharacterized protein LOC116774957 n=1 Tax=Danaus plexippus TaxID=13037 RepID=UPI002AB0470B|nr:uncharacterized protein LOC116774957 [Danaus plexippus]